MNEEERSWSPAWIAAFVALSSPAFIGFYLAGYTYAGEAAWIALFILLVCVRIRLELRHRWWFWPIIVGLAALHAIVIIVLASQFRWVPVILLGPFIVLDTVLDFAVVNLAERLTRHGRTL